MPVNSKAIKLRIRSVNNTKKITKAMEMVSAAKMRRAVDATLRTRPYAALAHTLMQKLSKTEAADLPLLSVRPVKKMLVIFIASNRGLCGSFNSNIMKKMAKVLADKANVATHRIPGFEDVRPAADVQIDMIGIGRKSVTFAKRQGLPLTSVYENLGERPQFEDVLPICRAAIDGYVRGEYDKVIVAYTDFKSSLVQEPKVRQILPISEHDLEKMEGTIEAVAEHKGTPEGDEDIVAETFVADDYVYEPDAASILTNILPRLVEVQVYQAVLESAASEHSARMVAMKNASSAASDMIRELNLSYNKARQAGITQEISEIVGGAAALG